MPSEQPRLPQHDPEKDQRSEELEQSRNTYELDYDLIPTVAMSHRVPSANKGSMQWYALVGKNALAVNANEIANRKSWNPDATRGEGDNDVSELEAGHEEDESFFAGFESFIETGQSDDSTTRGDEGPQTEEEWLDDAAQKVGELTAVLKPPPDPDDDPEELPQDRGWVEVLRGIGPSGRPQDLRDYDDLFNRISPIPLAQDFQDDAAFARMCVAGWNPVMIERAEKLPDHFPVTDEQFKGVMGASDSLDRAGAENRLFVADYEMLTGLTPGDTEGVPKYFYAPLALYALPAGERFLKPVAIQCDQTPSENSPVLSPRDDDWRWMMAKTALSVADSNFHELVSHLARTHLAVQPFVMATYRHLAKSHPVHVLLAPHFEGTLYINNMAAHNLIAPGGDVDLIFAGTIESSREVAVKGVSTFHFKNSVPPRSFALRGVQAEQVPFYPYRDDALRVWRAIESWVGAYLAHHYHGSDAEVAADDELQAWARALGPDASGGVNGFGTIQTLADLTEAVAMVIFTGSAQHAVVNFAQSEMMSYAPATSGAVWAKMPPPDAPATEQDWLDMLPPLELAEQQLSTLYQLGNVHYTELGQYNEGHFTDDAVVSEMIPAFQRDLKDVESQINEANANKVERPRPFGLLLPSKIPQSINI